MMRVKHSAFALAAAALVFSSGFALAQSDADQPNPPRRAGVSGHVRHLRQAQLQRGFQVYKEVCSACHALSIPFRTLADPGGPHFSEDQVRALAATYQVTNAEPNEKGEISSAPRRRPTSFLALKPIRTTRRRPRVGKAKPDMALLAKSLKYERGFPWFVFDTLPGLEYQEMGATTSIRS